MTQKSKLFTRTMALLAVATAVTPVIAASGLSPRDARERTEQVQHQVALAHRTGDAATIADARAKLKAAQAVQWAASHPAPDPNKQIASRR